VRLSSTWAASISARPPTQYIWKHVLGLAATTSSTGLLPKSLAVQRRSWRGRPAPAGSGHLLATMGPSGPPNRAAQQVSLSVSMDAVTVPFAFTVTWNRMCCLPSDPSEPCRTMLFAMVMVSTPRPDRSVKWPV
jgi:hypothetical protein